MAKDSMVDTPKNTSDPKEDLVARSAENAPKNKKSVKDEAINETSSETTKSTTTKGAKESKQSQETSPKTTQISTSSDEIAKDKSSSKQKETKTTEPAQKSKNDKKSKKPLQETVETEKGVEETEKTSPSPEKQRKKRAIIIATAVSLLLAIAIGISLLFLFCQAKPDASEPKDEPPVTEDTSKDEAKDDAKIDFGQKVTDSDGKDFSPKYELGSKTNLVARFPNLKCTDDKCENINEVKLGKHALKRGEDFEVKKGSVIITIFANTLENLPAGKYDLTFKIELKTGKILQIGLKITLEDKIPTCEDGEIIKDGKCVKNDSNTNNTKPNESKPNNGSNSSSNATKPDTNNKPSTPGSSPSPEQQLCEAQAGPHRVLIIHWMSDLEIATESARDESYWEYFTGDRYNPGDEILLTGQVWDTAETGMKWLNGKCQPRIRGASNMAGGADYLTRHNDRVPPSANRPKRDAVVWYWRDGSSRTEFVDGDAFTFIRNHI